MTATVPPLSATTSTAMDPSMIAVGSLGAARLVRGVQAGNLLDYRAHLAVHGPQPMPSRQDLLAELDAVTLTGRGGAGFGLAAKIRGLRAGQRPVIVVNGAEGEPASAKDTALLGQAPHVVLDGAAAIAAALGCQRVIVAVTSALLQASLRRSVASRPDAGLFEVRVVTERFIVGEARTLLRVLDGGPALPPGRRVLPTDRGLGGAPTLVSNTETYAHVALLSRLGAAGYSAVGTTDQPGTTLLTVSGAVARPGVLEVPFGVGLSAVAEAVGAAPAQALIVGGYHGTWLRPDPGLQISRASLAGQGATLGAGVVIFLGKQSCALAELCRVAHWLAAESAKQCGPCAFGLPAMAQNLNELLVGRGDPALLHRRASQLTGRGACAHPDGAVRFIASAGQLLADEFALHRTRGGCGRPLLGHLALTKSAALWNRS